MSRQIFVTFQKEGLHKWSDAVNYPEVEYLADLHRHVFHFRVDIDVYHDDREIEFIIFKHEMERTAVADNMSCEMMADVLGDYLIKHYPRRSFRIEVSEDGENGATITHEERPIQTKGITIGRADA